MAVTSPDRLRRDLVDLLHRAADVREYSLRAARIVGRSVPYDGVCMLTLDPATSLPTSEVSENGLPTDVMPRMAQIEIGVGDVNTFQTLIRSGRCTASLSEATDGDLDRSLRHRELRAPNGFGDELRTVLSSENVTWGGLSLLRGSDRGPFTPADATLVASLARHLAEGLRRAILLTALTANPQEDDGEAGLVLLAEDDSILMTDAAADAWLAQLGAGEPGAHLPSVVAAVASQTRTAVDEDEPLLARTRVRTPSGTWLVVRGSRLSGDGEARIAVTIEPARAHDLAPLIADAYGLTERERAVTQLVAQGLATEAIAGRLHISRWTVQDHLKSVFEKVGVSSRGELVARVFFEHYAPRLASPMLS
ncbi:MAG TPA: helix-turn-helix transcriptional regulator [Solirubrobacteraceae bacterium]|nr:helix-turn-helix transcriptional regulator [Solirubrobacteraceae bacterium]